MSVRNLGFLLSAGVSALVLAAVLGAGLCSTDGTDVERAPTAVESGPHGHVPAPTIAGRGQDLRQPALDAVDDPGNPSGSGDSSRTRVATTGELEDGDDDHVRDGLPLTASHPFVAPVIAVQNRWSRALMDHPLVVGTATGMNEDGDIVVLALAKAPIDDLPASVEGIPIDVIVTGELFASPGPPPHAGGGNGNGSGGGDEDATPSLGPTDRHPRPVPIGVSTGHPDITAGTIGCRVVDASGAVYALSNNHVYADENLATVGDDVLQPGTYDGGFTSTDSIGQLDAFVSLDFSGGSNTMDAAIALSDTATLGSGTPSDGYGTPRSTTAQPSINLRVRKYGRTTGQTNGRIQGINATVNVGYSTGTARFTGQIVVSGGSFSSGGDSGSLVIVQKGSSARSPVGLLFAGGAGATIASPIDPILTHFGVTIDGE